MPEELKSPSAKWTEHFQNTHPFYQPLKTTNGPFHSPHYKRAVSFSTTRAAEIIKFTKSIDTGGQRIYFNGTTPSTQDLDMGVSKTFSNVVSKTFSNVQAVPIPSKPCDGLIMPMVPNEAAEDLFIINAGRLEAITKGHRGKITLAVEDYSRAILLWLTPEKTTTRSKPATKKKGSASTVKQHQYSGPRFITRFGEKGYSILDQQTGQAIFTGTHKTGDDAKQIALLLNEPKTAANWLKTKPVTTNPQPEASSQKPAARSQQPEPTNPQPFNIIYSNHAA